MITDLDAILHSAIGEPTKCMDRMPIGGGSINDAFKLITSRGQFFMKVNTGKHASQVFKAEVAGLEALRVTQSIAIPSVVAVGEADGSSYLILELITESPRSEKFWHLLGASLAALHQTTNKQFGAKAANYIGSLHQSNTQHVDWVEFFVLERLEPLVKKARDNERLVDGDAFRFERLYNKLDSLLPKEAPALLHGDLWSGNQLCGKNSRPYLVDPAVYFGHREMDISMSLLFGGFEAPFYESYNRDLPLESGWKERVDIHNLYPILVHVILFGGNYTSRVTQILKGLV